MVIVYHHCPSTCICIPATWKLETAASCLLASERTWFLFIKETCLSFLESGSFPQKRQNFYSESQVFPRVRSLHWQASCECERFCFCLTAQCTDTSPVSAGFLATFCIAARIGGVWELSWLTLCVVTVNQNGVRSGALPHSHLLLSGLGTQLNTGLIASVSQQNVQLFHCCCHWTLSESVCKFVSDWHPLSIWPLPRM